MRRGQLSTGNGRPHCGGRPGFRRGSACCGGPFPTEPRNGLRDDFRAARPPGRRSCMNPPNDSFLPPKRRFRRTRVAVKVSSRTAIAGNPAADCGSAAIFLGGTLKKDWETARAGARKGDVETRVRRERRAPYISAVNQPPVELSGVVLRPGERIVAGERMYSAAWLNDSESTAPAARSRLRNLLQRGSAS